MLIFQGTKAIWILDSGATDHIVCNHELFTTWKKLKIRQLNYHIDTRVSSQSINDTIWLEYFEDARGIPKYIGVRLGLVCLIVKR